jgi:hypothetical protein
MKGYLLQSEGIVLQNLLDIGSNGKHAVYCIGYTTSKEESEG